MSDVYVPFATGLVPLQKDFLLIAHEFESNIYELDENYTKLIRKVVQINLKFIW